LTSKNQTLPYPGACPEVGLAAGPEASSGAGAVLGADPEAGPVASPKMGVSYNTAFEQDEPATLPRVLESRHMLVIKNSKSGYMSVTSVPNTCPPSDSNQKPALNRTYMTAKDSRHLTLEGAIHGTRAVASARAKIAKVGVTTRTMMDTNVVQQVEPSTQNRYCRFYNILLSYWCIFV